MHVRSHTSRPHATVRVQTATPPPEALGNGLENEQGRPSAALTQKRSCPVRGSGAPPTDPILTCTEQGNSALRRHKPRGELRLTHAVLDSRLSPLAKLVLAAVEYFQPHTPSYEVLEALLPARTSAIPQAIREAEAADLVTVHRPTRRKRGTPRFDGPNVYRLELEADPSRNGFTRLWLPDSDRTPGRWILRALYEREQGRRGAIYLPDVIAAQRAGMTPTAVRQARESWRACGDLTIFERGRKGRPAVLVLADSPYPARPERLERKRFALHRLELAGTRFDVWATTQQASSLRAAVRRNQDKQLARAYAEALAVEGVTLDALRVFRLLDGPVTSASGAFDLSASRLEACRSQPLVPDPIPV
jgi:hypothetical protein